MDDLQGMDAPIKIRDKVTFQELKKVLARSCGVDTSDLEGVGLLAGIVIKHENGAVLRLLGPTTREGGEPGAQSAPAAQLMHDNPNWMVGYTLAEDLAWKQELAMAAEEGGNSTLASDMSKWGEKFLNLGGLGFRNFSPTNAEV